jgi:hypothetical protein
MNTFDLTEKVRSCFSALNCRQTKRTKAAGEKNNIDPFPVIDDFRKCCLR